MENRDFEEFLQHREAAAQAYVSGDGVPLEAILAKEDAASFLGPTGEIVFGAERVAERYLEDAKAFHPNGETHFEVMHLGSSGDLAFWTGFQVAMAQIGDMPAPMDMRLRVTEIFRRERGEWKLIHRHADLAK